MPGPKPVAEVYGLGACVLYFRYSEEPSPADLLDEGATQAELDGLIEQPGMPGLAIAGSAARDGEALYFEWPLPSLIEGTVTYASCLDEVSEGDAGLVQFSDNGSPFQLNAGDALQARAVVHGENLFRLSPDRAHP